MAGADITQFTRLDKLMQAAAGRTARQAAKPLEGDTGHIFMLGKITREQLVDTIRLQLAGMGFVLGSFQRHRLQAIFQLYLGTESHGLETDGLRTYLVRGLYGRALQRDLQIPQPIDMPRFPSRKYSAVTSLKEMSTAATSAGVTVHRPWIRLARSSVSIVPDDTIRA